MARPLSIAATLVGVAGLVSIACSGSFDPQTATFQSPERAGSSGGPTVTAQTSGTTNRLQAVSAVNDRIVWASGVGGTFVRTTDGGRTWEAGVVAGGEALEFRDVEAVSDKVAYLLAAGTGTDSRIYKTTNGGQSWTLQFQNDNPDAFYDCFAFWSPDRGLTFSDPVNGEFLGVRTSDGRTWQTLPDQDLDLTGEFGFAASGTCVAVQGDRRAWVGTGGARARILATTDRGNTWTAYDTPLAASPSGGGVFSVEFRDARHGVLAGGDFTSSAILTNFARSRDGGQTWAATTSAPIPGAIFGLSYLPGRNKTVVATGPGGTAWSPDEGDSWTTIPDVTGFWAITFASRDAGWAVGTEGRILKIGF